MTMMNMMMRRIKIQKNKKKTKKNMRMYKQENFPQQPKINNKKQHLHPKISKYRNNKRQNNSNNFSNNNFNSRNYNNNSFNSSNLCNKNKKRQPLQHRNNNNNRKLRQSKNNNLSHSINLMLAQLTNSRTSIRMKSNLIIRIMMNLEKKINAEVKITEKFFIL